MSKAIIQKKSRRIRVQYRVDEQRKKEAEAILKAQGIKPSQAIDMFLAEVIQDQGFPFKPCPIPNCGIPNEETAKALEESEKGIGVETYGSAEEMFRSLKKLK